MVRNAVLLLGASGQVGSELSERLGQLGNVLALTRREADLSAPESLRGLVRDHRPTIIVNAAAYTAVDKAESEPEEVHTINALAPGVLAEEAERLGSILVHYSTDYVFDGSQAGAYAETDRTNPVSVYGSTKLEGERAVERACSRHLIFRTSWVFGVHGSNFLKTMLRVAADRHTLNVVADQIGAPTSAALIADTTVQVLRTMAAFPAEDARWGVYHLAAGGETSWHGYAQRVISEASSLGRLLNISAGDIGAITTADYPTPARRPANSRLDTTRLRETFGVELPDWKIGVDGVLAAVIDN